VTDRFVGAGFTTGASVFEQAPKNYTSISKTNNKEFIRT
jgi:hypothetical protein